MAIRNTCDCPDPPGGRAVCEPHQLAICRVREGVSETQCVDPPREIRDLLLSSEERGRLSPEAVRKVQIWAIQAITGKKKLLFPGLSARDAEILRRGLYRNETTGEVVTFKLPVVSSEEPGPEAVVTA